MKNKILSFTLIAAMTGVILSGCSSQKAASSDKDSTKMKDTAKTSTPMRDTTKRDTTHH